MAKRKLPAPLLTVERAREKVSYDAETGIITWKQSIYKPGLVGAEAGWVDTHGHRVIEIDGRRYKASRLAWFYTFGRWPKHEIDHRDRDPSNNRLSNLREATRTENVINRSRTRRNGLPRGVDPNKKGFMARVRRDGRLYHLGTFPTPEEASAAYEKAATALFGEFLPER